MHDKRMVHDTFRERIQTVLDRFNGNQSKFAASIGLDRSALSQLLSGRSARLPRAETLVRIAASHGISLDWLLGLSQTEASQTEIAPMLEIEEVPDPADQSQLAKWHRDAIGTKVRYVPAFIPDLLRTPEVIAYETAGGRGASRETQIQEAEARIDDNRLPETDMEVCMAAQTLVLFARGAGLWSGLDVATRRAQIRHMAALVDELYPNFRLFLYDIRETASAPYTVFGTMRAAVYMGDMYLVLNGREQIRALTRHFDGLIRKATVNAHEVSAHIAALESEI